VFKARQAFLEHVTSERAPRRPVKTTGPQRTSCLEADLLAVGSKREIHDVIAS